MGGPKSELFLSAKEARMKFTCFHCGEKSKTPIRFPCPTCRKGIDHLDGTTPSISFIKKYKEHTDLIGGSGINLYGKTMNCSFDHIGVAKLSDLVEFTMNFGHEATVLSLHGGHPTPVRVAYIPQVFGRGAKKSDPYTLISGIPCSGCCVMSPCSIIYGHPFPVITEWVSDKFATSSGNCSVCGVVTSFGMGVCGRCYSSHGYDWQSMLDI